MRPIIAAGTRHDDKIEESALAAVLVVWVDDEGEGEGVISV